MKFLVFVTIFIASTALAEKFEPAPFANYFTPTIESILEYDDNIYTTEFSPISSYKFHLIPSILLPFLISFSQYNLFVTAKTDRSLV